MELHAFSRGCHHDGGTVWFKWDAGDVEEFIVGIAKPHVKREAVVAGRVGVDVALLDRVFALPITTVKSIPHSCRMAFSQALGAALGNVAAMPESVEEWVKLLLLPRCTLRVFRPSTRQEAWCPSVLAEFVASAPLTPLLKLDNGIRPISVGAIWRRLVSKVAMRGVGKEIAKYLCDFQFGVGVPSGAEVVLHSANRFLNQFHSDVSSAMLTVDFFNAFNLVDRTSLLHEVRSRCPSISLWVDFLYGQSARLYVGDAYIRSTTGVQQGEPLGPLLFALVLHPFVHRIRDRCKLLFHAWYLDDGTIIGDTKEVANALDIIRAEGPRLGLELNVKKTELFWPTCNGEKEAVSIFDNDLRGAIEDIVVCRGPFFGDFQWRLASLPTRFGGLGLCSARDVSTYAFVASRAQSWSLQDHILRGCSIDGLDTDYGGIVQSLESKFDLSSHQKAVFECLRAPRAQDFLTVIPIEGLGQHMLGLEYRAILKYRLMIPMFPIDEPCPVFRKVCLDSFGDHAVHCKELPGFKYRHDLVRDVQCDILKWAGISAKKEAPVNFLTDPLEGRSTL
ncbi:uncharacterized protein LOC143592430 [Bidens hawaiensis]|uniref:uncharacterized protein LOC143592430 n=1 Tax=Bidens hawaiensis TaxID=980011 RepID=UPI00404A58ED